MFRQLLIAAFVALPSVAQSAPRTFVCDTETGQQQSLLQDQIVFAYDAEAGKVSVADAAIIALAGGPLAARVSSDNTTRLVFSWTLENVRNATGQVSTLDYRAVYFKATNQFDVSLKPRGFDNSFQASGTCRPE